MLAAKNRVLGELHARASSADAPQWWVHELRARAMALAYANDLKSQATRAIGEALAREGIACVALKGFHLAHGVYRHPHERPFGDLDLLVLPSERDAAQRVLLDLGFEPGHMQTGQGACEASFLKDLLPSLTLDVDLHWRLVGPLSLVREMRLDAAGLFARSKPAFPGLRFPSPEDALVIAAINLVRHGFRPLGNILDFRELVRLADPYLLIDRVRNSRTRSALSAGLSLAVALFGAKVPDDIACALVLPRWQSVAFRRLLRPADLARPEGADGATARYLLKVLAQDGSRGVIRTATSMPNVIARRFTDAATSKFRI